MPNIFPLDRVEKFKDIITLGKKDKNTLSSVPNLSVPNPLSRNKV
jgi:hypothetical protein